MFTDPVPFLVYSVVIFSLATYGGYLLGKRHGEEGKYEYINEFIAKYSFVSQNPITYRCCEHCLNLDGEYNDDHWEPDTTGAPVRRFHFHDVPCTESWCYKGQLINTEDRNPTKTEEIDNG